MLYTVVVIIIAVLYKYAKYHKSENAIAEVRVKGNETVMNSLPEGNEYDDTAMIAISSKNEMYESIFTEEECNT